MNLFDRRMALGTQKINPVVGTLILKFENWILLRERPLPLNFEDLVKKTFLTKPQEKVAEETLKKFFVKMDDGWHSPEHLRQENKSKNYSIGAKKGNQTKNSRRNFSRTEKISPSSQGRDESKEIHPPEIYKNFILNFVNEKTGETCPPFARQFDETCAHLSRIGFDLGKMPGLVSRCIERMKKPGKNLTLDYLKTILPDFMSSKDNSLEAKDQVKKNNFVPTSPPPSNPTPETPETIFGKKQVAEFFLLDSKKQAEFIQPFEKNLIETNNKFILKDYRDKKFESIFVKTELVQWFGRTGIEVKNELIKF
jgi:uncharacterized protein YdaU (DUF1376 family)